MPANVPANHALHPRFETVQFHDDQIEAIRGADGRGFVVIKRICDNLDVDLSTQLRKLKSSHWAGVVEMTTPDARGREQSHSVIPIDSLPMWLVTIHPGKIAEPLRDKLRRYQLEARDVLARHFSGTPETPPLETAVDDPLVHQARMFLAMAERTSEIAKIQVAHGERLKAIEAKVDAEIVTQTGDTTFMSILGYCNTRGIRIPSAQMSRAGKAATEICRIEGHEIGKCHSEKWGQVGSYPIEVLDRVFASYGKDVA